MNGPKRDDPVHFRFMNEVAIIDQLGSRLFERVLPDDMTLAQFGVLNHFVRRGQPSAPLRLASAFQVTKGAMTKTLQHLERKGHVAVVPDPDDGRAKIVTITPTGTAAREAAIAALQPILGRLAQAVPADDVATALPILARIRSYLDSERDEL